MKKLRIVLISAHYNGLTRLRFFQVLMRREEYSFGGVVYLQESAEW
jgi:hypothetical protein